MREEIHKFIRVRVSHQLRWLRATGSLTPHLDTLNAKASIGSVPPSRSPYASGVPKFALSGRAFIAPGFAANLIPKIEVSPPSQESLPGLLTYGKYPLVPPTPTLRIK